MTGMLIFPCVKCGKQVNKRVKDYKEAQKVRPICDECKAKAKERVNFD